MQIDTAKFLANWKTTAMGLAVMAIAVLRSVQFDVAGHLAMTAKDWCGVLVGVLAMGVSAVQKDAGTEQAQLPSGQVETVSSHEIPDDPTAQVIK